MRELIKHVGPAVGAIALLAFGASCQPTRAGLGGGGSGGSLNTSTGTMGTGTGTNATSATTGTGFGTSSATTGTSMMCMTPNCLGMGMQGGCDSGLAIDGSASDGAKAIGLCQQFTAGAWGLKSATWVEADGTTPLPAAPDPLSYGHGLLTKFGSVVKPREGATLLALSSGTARQPGDPNYVAPGKSCTNFPTTGPSTQNGDWKNGSPQNPPTPAYPKAFPSCPANVGGPGTAILDSAGLKLVIHTPIDAKSLSFDFDFYTYEFPDYVCTSFNDFFVAMLTPKPTGLADPNISFDSMNNNISVNAGFLQACTPQSAGGKNFACPKGPGELAGTGFDNHINQTNCLMGGGPGDGSAATSWLTTTAPIPADADITLSFAVWDSGDGNLDSTVLIDNFKITTMPLPVGTMPAPM